MVSLGLCYEKGTVASFKWYSRAAEAGNVGALYNLGVCYRDGKGVAADARAAVKWWTRAAEAGLAEAQHNLGVCYATGAGVVRDFAAARMWWMRAAAAGIAEASASLARLNAQEAAQ